MWGYVVAIYLGIVNLLALLMFGFDKIFAKRESWRIRESNLFIVALLGGSIGALFGMYLWRHKTEHLKFKFGIPLILTLQIAAIIVCWLYF